MAGKQDYNYGNLDSSPYNGLLTRKNDLLYTAGQESDSQGGQSYTAGGDDGTLQTAGGSVSTVQVKTEGNATDTWILNFIRSVNWKPKKIGFYINGQTGYAEFANVYVSGTIVVTSGSVGGFDIGSDYIRDHLNTMGLASTVTAGDDVRFWAGDTFANRSTAPWRVLESGRMYASDVVINGGSISGAVIINLSGTADPTIVPAVVGQIYVNTLQERIFMSVGTASSNDWVLVNTAHLTRLPSASDNITVSDVPTIRLAITKLVSDSITVSENINLITI